MTAWNALRWTWNWRRSLALALGIAAAPLALAQQPLRIGIVTFLSGPASAPFGMPARNAAEVVVDSLNAGKLPAPYTTKGFGGTPLELVIIDENGGTTTQVAEYRNLVQRVDIVIGYISSGSCLAVAPVAEELKKLTVFFDCGTPRIFEDASYKYVFRTHAHATMDSVGAARYVLDLDPNVKSIAGLNQNYAWGQDSWNDFEAAMKALKPDIEVKTSQMPKLFSGQFGPEISALLSARAQFLHSSFWGGDLEAFVLQAAPRTLFDVSRVILTTGETALARMGSRIPDGTIVGARGTHGMFAPPTELNRWFRAAYQDRYQRAPVFPAYHMVQAILGTKAAYEKAQKANGGRPPSQDQIIAAFEGLTWETPSGTVRMALGKGHQAIHPIAYGTTKLVDGQVTLVNVKHYAAELVNPPEGVKGETWIKSGFKAK
jgi:branched-chain amino acid transport system substrate-binding protein